MVCYDVHELLPEFAEKEADREIRPGWIDFLPAEA